MPAKEKIYGRTDHVVEDIGTGAEDIYISFCAPEQMGFDMSRFHAPNVAAVYGGYGFDQPQGAMPSDIRAPAIMCHFIREIDGGVEFRSRFWMGYKLIDGKPVLSIPPGESVPPTCRTASPTTTSGVLQPQVAAARDLGGVQGRRPGSVKPGREEALMPMKLMAASRRRPGLTRAEYFRYIEHYHGTVARLERFKIEKYIQNHVIDGAFGVISDADGHKNKVADRDAVVELHFDSFRDMLATLEPEGVTTSRANQDGKFFADEPTNIIVMAEETELPVAKPTPDFNPGLGEPGKGALKVMQYIMRRPDVFPQDFHRLWRQAHDEALAASPYASDMFRKIVVSKRSRVNDNDAAARAHFKMVDPPVYDLVVSFILDSMEQAGAFRQYFDAITAARWSSPTGRSRSSST